jgi:hypothetical protein
MIALITGGIGDFLAILNHVQELPRKILVATPRAGEIAELAYALKIECCVLEAKRVYHTRDEVVCAHGTCNDELNSCEDWSISTFFMAILQGQRVFKQDVLARIPAPRTIDGDYVVCQANSLNYQSGRNLLAAECDGILIDVPCRVVVLGMGKHEFSANDRVLDLSGKTSVREACAILRHAKACYGVDSWMTNSAAVAGLPTSCKSVNSQYYFARRIYQGPHFMRTSTAPHLLALRRPGCPIADR